MVRVKNALSKDILNILENAGFGTLVSIEDPDGNDWDRLVIDIGPIEVPQFPVFDVRTVERVSIVVMDDTLPEVFCRPDFPIVPHLTVFDDGRKTLCLFDVPFQDIKYMFNANMFLKRIVYWFSRTARGELHQPDQPLESFFPSVRDSLILFPSYIQDTHFRRFQHIDTDNGVFLSEIPITEYKQGTLYAQLWIEIKKVFSRNIINKMPRTLGDLDSAFDESLLNKIIAQILPIWRIKTLPKLYDALFQQKETVLRNCPIILIILIALSRTPDAPVEQHTLKAFRLNTTLKSLYEAMGYKNVSGKLIKDKDINAYKEIQISPFEVLCSLDRKLANNLNGIKDENRNASFVQIGVGTLGSQIANNCIRSGYGHWTYIDPDIIYPHNLARHCLTQANIGKNKAQSMKEYSESILLSTGDNCVQGYIPASIFCKEREQEIRAAINKAQLIVDCSASVAGERYVCHELAAETRCVSFFMNPSGSSLIMLLESSVRDVALDTLEMQYYRLLLRTPELKDHLKSEQRVVYASSCRGTSLAYSQDNAAIFSGICSKAIKNIDASKEATIIIWTLNDLSLNCIAEKGEQFNRCSCNGWLIKTSSSFESKLYAMRKSKLPCETGGVLIGSFDFINKICYIVDSIDSPEDSEEYPCAYIRGSKGLLERINDIEETTIGNLTYIGEWHSHPTDTTGLSPDDKRLITSITEYTTSQSSPGCMIIVGETHIAVYLEP